MTPAYGFRFLREPPLGDAQEIAAWPRFDETAVTTMLIDLQSRVGYVPDRDRMAFWDSFYERW